MNKTLAFSLLLSSVLAGTAVAQDLPVETIYSDAQRSKDLSASRAMVETMLAPSFSIEGQYAKWKQPVCPHVYGLNPVTAWFVEHRIREVADMVGAKVDHNDPCVPNIGIFFTPDPQASLLSIAEKRPFLIAGGSQKAVVKFPVQAWYATFITDFNGHKSLDIPWDVALPWTGTGADAGSTPMMGGAGSAAQDRSSSPSLSGYDEPMVRANDSRLHTGLTAEMATATVMVDTKTATGMTLGELSDYLAFMTLAQASQYGACLPLETVSNLLTPGCAAQDTAHQLSHADVALLTALYEVPDSPEVLQKQRVIGAMRRSLEKQYGKN